MSKFGVVIVCVPRSVTSHPQELCVWFTAYVACNYDCVCIHRMGVRTPEVTNPPKLVKCPVYFVKIMLAEKALSDNS